MTRRYRTTAVTSAGAWADATARAVGRVAHALRAHPAAREVEIYRSAGDGHIRVEPVLGAPAHPRDPAMLVGRYSAGVTIAQLIDDIDAALAECGATPGG